MKIIPLILLAVLLSGCITGGLANLGGVDLNDLQKNDRADIYGCIKGPPPGGAILVVPKGTKIPLERIPVC